MEINFHCLICNVPLDQEEVTGETSVCAACELEMLTQVLEEMRRERAGG